VVERVWKVEFDSGCSSEGWGEVIFLLEVVRGEALERIAGFRFCFFLLDGEGSIALVELV